MQAIVDSSDGDLARAVAASSPGSAEAADSELYRRFAPRVRLYGLRHLRDEEAARDLAQQVMLVTIEKLRAGAIRDADQMGRLSGIVSRAIVNRLQRDGVHVRMFSLVPGETVACAVFPGDDLIVTCLRADFSGVEAVTLSVTGPGGSQFARYDDVPVSGQGGEVFWANPAALVHQMASMRLELTLTSAGTSSAELGQYVLEHSASTPPE